MSASRRTPREEVLRRCFELPWHDLYEVWQVIGTYMEAAGAKEPKVAKQLRERAEAVDCLRKAAQHHRLPDGEAPTIEQYDQARHELELPLSRRQIELRWESWHFAKLALTGERPVETPAQRSLRRAASGRRRGYEEHLAGVRRWLDEKPASTTREDYNTWARHYNDNHPAETPLARAQTIEAGLALSWAWVLRVADFEMEIQEAQQAYLEELTAASAPLGLIGPAGIALIFGVSKSGADLMTRQADFPPPVAVLDRARVWYRSDIEAHREGKRVRRQRGELQPDLVDSAEVSRRLGLALTTLTAYVHRNERWAPQPTGRAGGKMFWLRSDFEAWLRANPPRRRPRN